MNSHLKTLHGESHQQYQKNHWTPRLRKFKKHIRKKEVMDVNESTQQLFENQHLGYYRVTKLKAEELFKLQVLIIVVE